MDNFSIEDKDFTIEAEKEPNGSFTVQVKVSPEKSKDMISIFNKNHRKKYGINGLGEIPDSLAKKLINKKKVSQKLADKLIPKIPKIYDLMFSIFANTKIMNHAPRKVIHIDDHNIDNDGQWTITCTVSLEPEAKVIGDFDNITLEIPLLDSKRYVDDRIKNFAILNPYLHNKVDDDGNPIPAEEWDMLEVSIEAFIGKDRFVDGCEEEINIRLVKESISPPDLYEKLVGSKPGDRFIAKASGDDIPVHYKKSVGDNELQLEVCVNYVYKCTEPEIDDDLAISAGFNSLEEWKDQLRNTANNVTTSKDEINKKQAILNYLNNLVEIEEYPDDWAKEKAKELGMKESDEDLLPEDILKIKDYGRQVTSLKAIGRHLNIEWVGEHKDDIYNRDESTYVDKVLRKLIDVVNFKYVDRTPEEISRRDRERGESSKAASDRDSMVRTLQA